MVPPPPRRANTGMASSRSGMTSSLVGQVSYAMNTAFFAQCLTRTPGVASSSARAIGS